MSRGSSGLSPALRIVLDVATSLRMYAGAMLLRTGSQSVLVHRTTPVMVLMVLFSCTSVEEIGMCRVPPNWSTVLSHTIALSLTEGLGYYTVIALLFCL